MASNKRNPAVEGVESHRTIGPHAPLRPGAHTYLGFFPLRDITAGQSVMCRVTSCGTAARGPAPAFLRPGRRWRCAAPRSAGATGASGCPSTRPCWSCSDRRPGGGWTARACRPARPGRHGRSSRHGHRTCSVFARSARTRPLRRARQPGGHCQLLMGISVSHPARIAGAHSDGRATPACRVCVRMPELGPAANGRRVP